MTLHELYEQREWLAFATKFLDLYANAPIEEQLIMIRELLCHYRRNEVLELICPSL